MKSSSIAPASRIFARPSRASRRLRWPPATPRRAAIKSPRGPEDDSGAAAPVAFEGTLGETRRPMTSRARATLLALATIAIPALGLAQFPLDQQGRHGLRDRYNQPQNHQKLDENIRKLNGDDPEARLEAVRALGEINEPKAIEYLLQAANDPDMRIRIKAIDTLGNPPAAAGGAAGSRRRPPAGGERRNALGARPKTSWVAGTDASMWRSRHARPPCRGWRSQRGRTHTRRSRGLAALMRTGWRLGRSAAAVETRVFVCRAGFASRGRTVERDPDGTPSRPVRDPRCLGSRS